MSENTILTCGNECVEVKEGSSGNVIEHNSCFEQRDEESGCYCSRGDNNIIRWSVSVIIYIGVYCCPCCEILSVTDGKLGTFRDNMRK